MKQETIKEIMPAVAGTLGAGAAWSLSDIAVGTSIFAAICTALCMLMTALLQYKKFRNLGKIGTKKK